MVGVLPAVGLSEGATVGIGMLARRQRTWAALRDTPSAALAAYGALVVALVAYVGLVVARGASWSTPLDGWAADVIEAAGTALLFWRARRRGAGDRIALLLALAASAWTAGDVLQTVGIVAHLGTLAAPVDVLHLAFYPLAALAVGTWARGDVAHRTVANWLDGIVAGLGAASLWSAFAARAVLHDVAHQSMTRSAGVVFPVGDLALFALVCGVLAVAARGRRVGLGLVAAGCASNAAGDTLSTLHHLAAAGAALDALAWPLSIVALSLAAWLRPPPLERPLDEIAPDFFLPALATLASVGVLAVGTFDGVSLLAGGFAVAALVTSGLRAAVSVGALRRLTEHRHAESLTDELTGLSNRRYLFQALDAFFARSAAPDALLAFLFIDLNRFKEINDSFGHHVGDELLRQIGPRLSGALRQHDSLVRLGGDEFALVLRDASADDAVVIAERLQNVLEEPFSVGALRVQVSASIGIALAPRHARDSAGLVRCADVAMYRAKVGGQPFAVYDETLAEASGTASDLLAELRSALDGNDGIEMHYQPQLDLATDVVRSVEALVRWQHPRLGMLSPGQFLPLAEEAGLGSLLTDRVLELTLADCRRWQSAGREVDVAVNVSASDLADTGFPERVRARLETYGVAPERLVLEVAEGALVNEATSRGIVEELGRLGVRVSVDDFGAGFVSLAYLGEMVLHELKLDRGIVAALAGDATEASRELVRATISFAHALGLHVVAEGVEGADVLDVLRDLGCDVVQGYHVHRPAPSHELAGIGDTGALAARRLRRAVIVASILGGSVAERAGASR